DAYDRRVSSVLLGVMVFFFFSSRRRHTRSKRDWSSDVCSSDLTASRCCSIAASVGGTICAPEAPYTLMPLSPAGLWEAVTMRPATAPRDLTAAARTGVGTGAPGVTTTRPCAASTRQATPTKRSEP